MYRSLPLLLIATTLALPAAAQEKPKTRVVIKNAPPTVIVDDDGKARLLPFGDGHGWAWVGRGDQDGGLRYLNLGPNRRFIGVQLMNLTPELRQHFGVEGDGGVMVAKILEDTPAERAGIAVGDIITAVDGKSVVSAGDLSRTINDREDGDPVAIEIVRDGRPQRLDVGVELRQRRLMDVTPKIVGDHRAFVQELEDGADVGAVLEQLDHYFQSEDWKERLQHLEATDWGDVEERMKAVERRLRELEDALAEGK